MPFGASILAVVDAVKLRCLVLTLRGKDLGPLTVHQAPEHLPPLKRRKDAHSASASWRQLAGGPGRLSARKTAGFFTGLAW